MVRHQNYLGADTSDHSRSRIDIFFSILSSHSTPYVWVERNFNEGGHIPRGRFKNIGKMLYLAPWGTDRPVV